MNRKKQPDFKTIDKINFIKIDKIILDNGIKLHAIGGGVQEVVKVDLLFKAGYWEQNQALVAFFTSAMMIEGTTTSKSDEIAEKLDFYGAHLSFGVNRHLATVSLFTLNKHLESTLAIVQDLLLNATFPEKEFSLNVSKQVQKYKIASDKVTVLSKNEFTKALFGKNHPYASVAILKDYSNVNTSQLKDFYNQYYSSSNCEIVVSGMIDNNVTALINKYLGGKGWDRKFTLNTKEYKINTAKNHEHIVEKKDAVQNSIRYGKVLINQLHPDFHGMQILNTILGGYFGSRLMMNIREDKGYTYGIGSVIQSLPQAGYFSISTEVASGVTNKALAEIKKEIEILKTDLIPQNELTLVKNYLMGELLGSFDGPFSTSETIKSLLEYNQDYTFFDKAIETIKNITSNDLIGLANKYFADNTMITVYSGLRDK